MKTIMIATDTAMPAHVRDQAREALAAVLAAQPAFPAGRDEEDMRQARNALLMTQWAAFAIGELQPNNKAIVALASSVLAPLLAMYDIPTQARILQLTCDMAIENAGHLRAYNGGGKGGGA